MSEEQNNYSLVPEYDEDGQETGYYTREPDGVSGMTVSALSEFCGLASGSTTAVSNLLTRIQEADPETNNLEDSLKPLAGKDWRLETNDLQGRVIIPDEVCQAITEYYAFEAREYAGKPVAIQNYRAAAKAGIRFFIWAKTGFVPEPLRPSLKANTTVYIERLENIRDHDVPDDLWTTFREGAEVLLLIEKEMGVPVDRMDLCDGSIGSRWKRYREGRLWAGIIGSYIHRFRDQRGDVVCNAYNLSELSYFRRWLNDVYVPQHLPEYLVAKYGKRAIRQVYQEMGDLTPRVLEVTEEKRSTSKQDELYQQFLNDRARLLPGFIPKYRIEGSS